MRNTKINWTSELKELIITRYKQNESLTKIAKDLKISVETISSFLKKNGFVIVNRQNQLHWSIEEIIDLYNQGYSLTKIAKLKNTSRNTLSRHLKNAGIAITNRQNETKFNENIFDTIDTEEKAYWLGFIYADGYIANIENKKPRYAFEISLCSRDITHLNKFNKFMEYKGNNVKLGKVQRGDKIFNRCRWAIVNKHLWHTLNEYGCTPNKSLTLSFPNISIFHNKSLIRHFIRGYFDGDGSFSRNIFSKKVYPYISILGTEEFLKSIISNIKTKLHYRIFNNNKYQNITKVLSLHRMYDEWFINYIYNDAKIYLDRKYELYKFFKNGCRSIQEWIEFNKSKSEEVCDDNSEVNVEIKESTSPYSVEIEPEKSE